MPDPKQQPTELMVGFSFGRPNHGAGTARIKRTGSSMGGAFRGIGGANAGVYYRHGDHLGSTSVISDSSGLKIPGSEVQYAPFGEMRSGELPALTDFGYTGQRLDRSTGGLMYYGTRYYLPGLRRFISADSVVPTLFNSQALNRYTYVFNNPLNFSDPSGHWPRPNMPIPDSPTTPSHQWVRTPRTGVMGGYETPETTARGSAAFRDWDNINSYSLALPYYAANGTAWSDLPYTLQEQFANNGVPEDTWESEVIGGGNAQDIAGTSQDIGVYFTAVVVCLAQCGPVIAAAGEAITQAAVSCAVYIPYCAQILGMGGGAATTATAACGGDCSDEVQQVADDPVAQVLDESLNGAVAQQGNMGSQYQLTVSEAQQAGQQWVGPNAQTSGNMGWSIDGNLRWQYRFDMAEMEFHLELFQLQANGDWVRLVNNHIPIAP